MQAIVGVHLPRIQRLRKTMTGINVDRDGPGQAESSASAAAAVFKRLHPEQYLSRFLSKGYRPDGRKLGESRQASINTGSISTANGSALVRIGATTVVCGIKAEIAEPEASRPDEGYIVPNIDLPALCSPRFKPGPPTDEAQVLSNWLHELLISSQVVDLKSLCIVPGKAVWVLYLDVVCINFDGNAFDAAVLAVIAALRDTKLHGARYSDETGRVHLLSGRTYGLKLGRIPLSASFGIFSKNLLPDSTAFESPLLSTTITVALDQFSQACLLRHEGIGGTGEKPSERILAEAWNLAEARIASLRETLEESA